MFDLFGLAVFMQLLNPTKAERHHRPPVRKKSHRTSRNQHIAEHKRMLRKMHEDDDRKWRASQKAWSDALRDD